MQITALQAEVETLKRERDALLAALPTAAADEDGARKRVRVQ